MTLTGTNHGLSPLPNADEAQRLVHSCPFIIDEEGDIMVDGDGNTICVVLSGCFNDATAPLGPYASLDAAEFGHAGIDFAVGEGTRVHAMYGGRVTTATTGSGNKKGYGKYIEIESCTNPERQSGFVHRYAHLSEVLVRTGDEVDKGKP